ncbi:hypothetical protein [Brevundimonas goettingensis]|uniref:Uncharacterized protein n=1 Tax=Brevundimonas goettingensis TaxID=2774190 RepID=A0A975C236_9CAUL|nr:hypothetical protein [Brevundimonas goettingensis]QTC92090.1 hypothetical protein IFJ75_04035 [Brevundimonas goettingensis]
MKRILAVVLAVAGVPLQAAAADPTVTPISAVQGRPLAEVLTRLGATRDPAPAVTLQTAEGRMDLYPVEELMPPTPEQHSCGVRLTSPDASWAIAAAYAMVRNGEVIGWINPPRIHDRVRGPGEDRSAYIRATIVEGHDPVLSVTPGRLPLSDADGFLRRRPDMIVPADAVLTHACQPLPPLPPLPTINRGRRRPASFDRAGLIQGLFLLPFAWQLPALNAERREALVAGPALYGRMQLGQVLPGGGQGFARANRGVRRYADAVDPGYEVLAINLGDEPSNNLSRQNRAALIGVRDGRVVWLADGKAAAGLRLVSALCINAERRSVAYRSGCTDFGFYSP